MIPLIVLVVAFAVFRVVGFAFAYFATWQSSLRAALGVMFLLTASAHWGSRRADLIGMVPRGFGSPSVWVTVTGFAELMIAAGLQIRAIAFLVAIAAAAMLVCIFPANAKATREKLTIGGRPVPSFGARLVIQIVFLAALTAAAWPH